MGLGLTSRLACVCGSHARSYTEAAELGRLSTWLGRFPFFLLLLFFPVSCALHMCIMCIEI
jgi:hypothetical protein